jgi:hypothetical protein
MVPRIYPSEAWEAAEVIRFDRRSRLDNTDGLKFPQGELRQARWAVGAQKLV